MGETRAEAMSEIFELRQEIQQLTLRLNSLELRITGNEEGKNQEPLGPSVAVECGKVAPSVPETVIEPEEIRESMSADAEEKEIKLCESAWSLLAVVGLTDAGRLDVAFSVLLLCFNIVMQVMFINILFDKSFLGSPFSDQVVHAQVWRTRSAHDSKHLDLADTSLVTRVCGEDNSLLVSSNQAKLISDINKFLGLNKESFTMKPFPAGVQLSLLCIILYILCVFKELRTVWNSFLALLHVPRSSRSVLEDSKFKSISHSRLVMLALAHATRFALACALLISGVQWLARTTSIVDLILNAVALGGILDIDEFLFVAMVPSKIQMAIQKLEAIKVTYRKKHSEAESMIFGICLLCAVLLPWFLLLEPLSLEMLEVKHQMCDGIQNFVVSYNADVQMAVGWVTTGELKNEIETLAEKAVDSFKLKTAEDTPKYFSMALTRLEFDTGRIRSMNEEAEYYPFCIETTVLHSSGSLADQDDVVKEGQVRLNSIAYQFNMSITNVSCADFKHLCDREDTRLLRLTCGETCGCTDPVSDPWYKATAQGCGHPCLEYRRQQMKAEVKCQDLGTPEANASWHTFWDRYVKVIEAYYGEDRFEFSNYSNTTVVNMKSQGCANLKIETKDPVTGAEWCSGAEDLFSPLSYLCPVSCGCRDSWIGRYCPDRCSSGGANSSYYGYGDS